MISKFKELPKKKQKQIRKIIEMVVILIVAVVLEGLDFYFMFSNQVNNLNEFIFSWVSLGVSSLIIFTVGLKRFRDFYYEVFKRKRLGMSTLVIISVVVAYLFSFYPLISNTILISKGDYNSHLLGVFFSTGTVIMAIISIGDYISSWLKLRSSEDLSKLSKLKPTHALKKVGDKFEEVRIRELNIGDVLFVEKGQYIPTDGILLSNKATVDQSLLTGESNPVIKTHGSDIIGSTLNIGESFEIKVNKRNGNTVIDSIINQVARIQQQKPKYQKVADRVSFVFIPIVLILSLAAFLLQAFVPGFNEALDNLNAGKGEGYLSSQSFVLAIYSAVSVLVVACPCSLGLAVPLALVVGSSKASKSGVIFNNADAYEKIKKITTLVFDKTGTVTKNKLTLVDYVSSKEDLKNVFSLERNSQHPIAKTLFIEFESKFTNDEIIDFDSFKEEAGFGVIGNKGSEEHLVTNLRSVKENNYLISDEIQNFVEKHSNKTLSFYVKDKIVKSVFALEVELTDSAVDTFKLLKKLKFKTVIISGDNKSATTEISEKLNVDEFYYETTPQEKADLIKSMQDKGEIVAYVGDGMNDLNALKQSDLSFSFNESNEIANSIADVSVLNSNIYTVYKALRISQTTRHLILLNLFWAFSYNVVLIPLTVLGFLPPYAAAICMLASEVIILLSTLFFKKKKISLINKKENKEFKNLETKI